MVAFILIIIVIVTLVFFKCAFDFVGVSSAPRLRWLPCLLLHVFKVADQRSRAAHLRRCSIAAALPLFPWECARAPLILSVKQSLREKKKKKAVSCSHLPCVPLILSMASSSLHAATLCLHFTSFCEFPSLTSPSVELRSHLLSFC